jgi:hypothetical protein
MVDLAATVAKQAIIGVAANLADGDRRRNLQSRCHKSIGHPTHPN